MKRLLIIFLLMLGACLSLRAQIPTVCITTSDGEDIVTKEWRAGVISWSDSTGYESDSRSISIRARGNSTFKHPKKPFAVQFESPTSVCGLEEAQDWLLLANFMDHSLLRNSLALTAASRMSVPYTSSFRNVCLVINGEWRGCYLLCGGVDIAEGRVEIPEGGWLIEGDTYESGGGFFRTPLRSLPFHIRYPESVDSALMESIADYMGKVEYSLYSDGNQNWADMIDLDSFADWWILHELCMNAEPNGPRSCYMLFDGIRLKAGPVWDFDLAFNPVGLDEGGDIRPYRLHRSDVTELTADSSFCSRALWYDALFKHQEFTDHLKQRWQSVRPNCLKALEEIDTIASEIEQPAVADQEKWGALDPARFDTSASWRESYDNLRSTYLKRIEWLDRQLSLLAFSFPIFKYPAAKVPSFLSFEKNLFIYALVIVFENIEDYGIQSGFIVRRQPLHYCPYGNLRRQPVWEPEFAGRDAAEGNALQIFPAGNIQAGTVA